MTPTIRYELWSLTRAWCIVNVGAQYSIELVYNMNSFVRISVCHFLVSQPAHSGFVSFTLSLSFCTVVNTPCVFHFGKACCSPKKICVCLFPVFTFLGNP